MSVESDIMFPRQIYLNINRNAAISIQGHYSFRIAMDFISNPLFAPTAFTAALFKITFLQFVSWLEQYPHVHDLDFIKYIWILKICCLISIAARYD